MYSGTNFLVGAYNTFSIMYLYVYKIILKFYKHICTHTYRNVLNSIESKIEKPCSLLLSIYALFVCAQNKT